MIEHGLPSHDELTVYGLGATWTDQQWLAQVFMYGVYSLGGYALLSIMACASVVGAFAIAAAASRSLGAGPRAIWVLFLPVLVSARTRLDDPRPDAHPLAVHRTPVAPSSSGAKADARRLACDAAADRVGEHARKRCARSLLVMLLGGYELVRSRGRAGLEALHSSTFAARRAHDPVRADGDGPLLTTSCSSTRRSRDKVDRMGMAEAGHDTASFYVLLAIAIRS